MSDLRQNYNNAIEVIYRMGQSTPEGGDSLTSKIVAYVHSLEEFKRIIEREAALKLKYKVVEPYSNYPVEDSVELFYMELESGIKGKRLKLPYGPIRELYMRDIERYRRQGHDWDYSCGEGGTGEWKYTFNQVKFNSQVINNTQIVNDYIELNLDVKLKLLGLK